MALISDTLYASRNYIIRSASPIIEMIDENEETSPMQRPQSTIVNEDENSFSTLNTIESESTLSSVEDSASLCSNEINKENLHHKRQNRLKNRSVTFAPLVEEFEIPSSRHSSISSTQNTIDFIDVLVKSYKLETSNNLFLLNKEKSYTPKTKLTRQNPNWREHRMRHLMNKLEELSLWDREQELKVAQAQFLREQKLEQIQDRQRTHDLCLRLMRQKHKSEIENILQLDRHTKAINDKVKKEKIIRSIDFTTPENINVYDSSVLSSIVKRYARQEPQTLINRKTSIDFYRQFEIEMNNKTEKVHEKLKPSRQILRACHSYYTPIPATVVPLFSQTYIGLILIRGIYLSNRYKKYPYDLTVHQLSSQVSSSDRENHRKSHYKRDVRVPLKEQMNDDDKHHYHHDEYNHLTLSSTLSKQLPSVISSTDSALNNCATLKNTPCEISLVHQRNPNDDLNITTKFSLETNENILQNRNQSLDSISTNTQLASISTKKRLKFIDVNKLASK